MDDGDSKREASRLKIQIRSFIEEAVSRQGRDGWLGPEGPDEEREIWGRFPLVLGMTVGPSMLTCRVEP